MKRAALLTTAVAALGGLLAASWWPAEDAAPTGEPSRRAAPQAAFSVLAAGQAEPAPAPQPAASPAALDAASVLPPFELNPGLRERLEAWWLDAGEAPDPATLKRLLAQRLERHFAPQDAARALALMSRYVDYRVALGQLAPPHDPSDPQALRLALDARQRVRQQHFGAEEYQALFGEEEAADRVTLARAEALGDPRLSERERAQALAAAEQLRTPAERAWRADALMPLAVGAETAAFDAQGVDAATRAQLRAASYGQAASDRLAALDAEEAQWQARLSAYAAAEARQAGAAELATLRQSLFTAEENLRVEAALRVRTLAAPAAAR